MKLENPLQVKPFKARRARLAAAASAEGGLVEPLAHALPDASAAMTPGSRLLPAALLVAALWDNRAAMHRAYFDYDPDEYRLLYRVLVRGELPISAAL